MSRREQFGAATLYLGDSRELAPTLRFDAVVSDPPYGIGYERKPGGKGKQRVRSGLNDLSPLAGDDQAFDPAPWLARPCVLWGANHYAACLPKGRWLAWNKLGGLQPWDTFSDVEFAWCSAPGNDRIFSHLWKGLVQAEKLDNGERVHPTQKPVALMEWCFTFLPSAKTIFDPFAGSGTTGVAALRSGLAFVGVEIDPRHFDAACRRLERAAAAPRLFDAPPVDRQGVLFGAKP